MTKVPGTETLYSYTLPENFGDATVIFNDKVSGSDSGNQTENLELPFETSKIYDEKTKALRDFTADDIPGDNNEPEEPGNKNEDKEVGSTVYVKVPTGWNGIPNIHYWNTVGGTTKWPGKQMKDEGNGIYSAIVPKSFGNVTIIINDGNNKITDKEGKSEFDVKLGSSIIFEAGEWKNYEQPVSKPEEVS